MITTTNGILSTGLRSAYLNLLEKSNGAKNQSIIVHHYGEVNQNFTNGLVAGIEDLLISYGETKRTLKRMFTILVESLQNIQIYSEEDELNDQKSYFILTKTKQYFQLNFGNLIKNKDVEVLKNFLNKVNELDEKELKTLYMDVLSNGQFSEKGGAGLGFLTIRIKTENKIKFDIETLDENISLFNFELILERQK